MNERLTDRQMSIAKHPNLHTLRILSKPMVTTPIVSRHDAIHASTVVQNFATHVLRFLSQHGSRIRVLDISEYLSDYGWQPNRADRNLHQWPKYTYTKGNAQDGLGVNRVVAVPLELRNTN